MPRAPPVTTATWLRHSIMLPFHMPDSMPASYSIAIRLTQAEERRMEMRAFGRTGMQLSVLGFGCGAVGGLMVRGDPVDQERTVARAIDAGANYFDTAVQYGNGILHFEPAERASRYLRNLVGVAV